MDFYNELLHRIEKIPSGQSFLVSQAYGEGWSAIPAGEKIRMSLKLKEEASAGTIPDVKYCGTIEGRTHKHKLYKKC